MNDGVCQLMNYSAHFTAITSKRIDLACCFLPQNFCILSGSVFQTKFLTRLLKKSLLNYAFLGNGVLMSLCKEKCPYFSVRNIDNLFI